MNKLTFSDVRSFQVDSRQVGVGDVFFALPGARVDGHQFLEQVSRQGAVGAIVAGSYTGLDYGLQLVRVPNVLEALQELARKKIVEKRPQLVCAVTGSVGKTTTKEFLCTLLGQRFQTAVTPGNANSQVGLPLTILNCLTGDEEAAVLEMAMTEKGQIRRLVEVSPPDVALITTVQLVHAGVFASLEEIAHAKAEIFSSPHTRLGLIPYDLPARKEIESMLPMRTFSILSPKADFFLTVEKGNLVMYEEGRPVDLGKFHLPGAHNRHNLAAALAMARVCGVSWEACLDGLPLLTLPERRLQKIEKNGVIMINDSYNACEVSIKAALESLPALCPQAKRKIAILGPVPDLGRFSQACHEAIGHHSLDHADLMFCLGEDCLPIVQIWREKGREALHFSDKNALTAAVRKELREGDAVLLKGKNSLQLWTLAEELFQ